MPTEEKLSQTFDIEHYNGTFLNNKNLSIHCYYWKPSVEPRALLLISHGYAEHTGPYEQLAKEVCSKGFFVFSHDHAGHGHSEGNRAFVTDIHHLVDDTVAHIQIIRQDYPDLPLFVCGHSMGGAIAVLTSLEKKVKLSGIVLIAPALAKNPETATFLRVTTAKIINKFFPHFPLIRCDYALISQNKKNVEVMQNDPMRFKSYWQVRPILALIEGAEEITKRTEEVQVPFLLFHGDDDKICHVNGSANFHEKAQSKDKTFKVYPGGYHSLLMDLDEIAEDCFEQTVKWLEARV
ncbi:monoglyceride lipase [Parasteatoda tepidariorum]|uniref:Monoglyceride lipase n=1 Tax=Parasteatoda tepidariorum TaxID=114398 RepID=A0A2L2Y0X6_PARTP|nr:monoglyceride lipase [Parasteatoda tepidariorum]